MLEEAKVVVRQHGDIVEGRRGEVDGEDERTTWDMKDGEQPSNTLNVIRLTEAPTAVERVEDFIAKKDAEYPDGPACNIGNGAQNPVTTRTGHSGCFRIGELCNSIRTKPVKKTRQRRDELKKKQSTHSIRMNTALKSR
jgi:hypothetical protein